MRGFRIPFRRIYGDITLAKKKIYAVVEGHLPGLYDSWTGTGGAEEQVRGYPGAVYKGFATEAEAMAWLNEVADGVPAFKTKGTAKRPKRKERPDVAAYSKQQEEALAAGKVVVYTDGGCEGNPGIGGYAAVILSSAARRELSGGYSYTTNNRMELMACIQGLNSIDPGISAILFSDSSYVVNGIEKGWAERWRRNGWRRRVEKELVPVKNADLWAQLLDLCDSHLVEFMKVKGHAGIPENERCDQLSTEVMRRKDLPSDEGFSG